MEPAVMPLTAKGQKIMKSMKRGYGSTKKAKTVFYASRNKGTISGVDKSKKPARTALSK